MLYDFDRCTGKLSNQREFLASKKMFLGGAAFSRNSKYLYVAERDFVYQIDADQKESILIADTVAVNDNFKPAESAGTTNFYLAQLAPDDKIYISMLGSHKYLHVIHEPNKKGKTCNIEQRGLVLPTKNYTTMPNFPNFRLGAAATPCNSVASEELNEKTDFKIYPNPTSDYLYLSYDKEKLQHSQLIISDVQGRILLQNDLQNDEVGVQNFPKGIYFLQILKENKAVFREKVVILE